MARIHSSLLDKLDDLLKRDAAGEDVAAELLACGEDILAESRKTPRMDQMDANSPLVTEKLLKKAKANGIGEDTLRNRIYTLKWPPNKAVSTPVRMKRNAASLGLTLEEYNRLKSEGLNNKDIIDKYKIGQRSFYNFKREHGLVKVYNTKREEVR